MDVCERRSVPSPAVGMTSVRSMVKEIQREVVTGELLPERASSLLLRLTALLGSCSEEIREADATYAQVLLTYLDTETKANRAKIRAEVTPEYQRKREARDTHDLIVELIRSLRQFLRTLSEEMRLAK